MNLRAILRIPWRFGVLPLLGAMADFAAPTSYGRRRTRMMIESTPTWLAPDPALRKAMDERAHLVPRRARPPQGFYFREADLAFEHPVTSIEREETFQVDRRTGVMTMHPYWDVDLVALLYRIPVSALIHGGRSKGLVRKAISRRFPALGFERQKKLTATGLYEHMIYTEGPGLWRGLAKPMRLATLGIVDENAVEHIVHRLLAAKPAGQAGWIWILLNLETWAHYNGSKGRAA